MDLLRSVIGWTVTGAWATSFVLDAMFASYEPPVSLHALMMLVAGAAFGGSMLKKKD